MTKISVIIPAYNAEAYIVNAISNIKKQTFTDFECIIVNDGSNDNTKKIVQETKGSDKRFQLINNKKNMGSAYARNVGLKKAKGEFVIFLDADDEYDKDLLRIAYDKARSSGGDITIFEYFINEPTSIDLIKRSPGEGVIIPKDVFVLTDIKHGAFNVFANALYNKMYKRSFLVNNNLTFDNDLRRAQDALFVTKSLALAKSIVYVQKYLYTYNVDVPNSAWQTISKYPYSGLQYLEKLHDFLQKNNLYKELHTSYEYTFISNANYALNKLITYQEQFTGAYKMTKELIKKYNIKLRTQAAYVNDGEFDTAKVLIDGTFEDYLLLKLKEQNMLTNYSKNIDFEKSKIIEELNKNINEQQALNKQLQTDNQRLSNEINRPKSIKESAKYLARAIKRKLNNDAK